MHKTTLTIRLSAEERHALDRWALLHGFPQAAAAPALLKAALAAMEGVERFDFPIQFQIAEPTPPPRFRITFN